MPALASAGAGRGVEQLQEALEHAGYPGGFSDLVMYPGHHRHALIKWIVGRLLGGKSIDELQSRAIVDGAETGAEEERFAKKCAKLLHVLGVKSSVDVIRGCGDEQQRLQLLLDLLQLLAAATPHLDTSSSSSGPSHSSSPGGPAAGGSYQAVGGSYQSIGSMEAGGKLLEHACGSVGRLCGESVQLFPADLARVLDQYSASGATLAQQQRALDAQLGPLSAKLAHLQAAAEPPAPGPAWDGAFGELQGALESFLGDADALTGLYRRELSVWSEDANSRPQPIGPTADIGAAASDVGAAYGDLMKLLEAAQKLRGAHEALMAPGQAGRQLGALMQGTHQQHLELVAQAARQEAQQLAQARQVLLDAAALREQ